MAETGSVPFLASSEGMPFLAFGAGAAGRVRPPGGLWVEPECVSGLSHLTPTPARSKGALFLFREAASSCLREEIQRPSERGGKGRCARSQPAWALSGPPHFFVPPTRPEWMGGSSGRKAQLSVCWQRQAASYF